MSETVSSPDTSCNLENSDCKIKIKIPPASSHLMVDKTTMSRGVSARMFSVRGLLPLNPLRMNKRHTRKRLMIGSKMSSHPAVAR